jgi:hypothetical protein
MTAPKYPVTLAILGEPHGFLDIAVFGSEG